MSRVSLSLVYASADNPWRRLPWTVPATLLLWTLFLWSFGHFIGKSGSRAVDSPSIYAQLMELPASASSQNIRPKRAISNLRPKMLPTKGVEAPTSPHDNRRAALAQSATNTDNNTLKPDINLPVSATAASLNGQSARGPSSIADSGAVVVSGNGRSTTVATINANMGARAIVRPMPQIPDDLREEAFNSAALASFHIAVDGRVAVELIRPTPNPRLNRILLASLKNWRFAPAIKAGHPVESTEEIVIRIEVK